MVNKFFLSLLIHLEVKAYCRSHFFYQEWPFISLLGFRSTITPNLMETLNVNTNTLVVEDRLAVIYCLVPFCNSLEISPSYIMYMHQFLSYVLYMSYILYWLHVRIWCTIDYVCWKSNLASDAKEVRCQLSRCIRCRAIRTSKVAKVQIPLN